MRNVNQNITSTSRLGGEWTSQEEGWGGGGRDKISIDKQRPLSARRGGGDDTQKSLLGEKILEGSN